MNVKQILILTAVFAFFAFTFTSCSAVEEETAMIPVEKSNQVPEFAEGRDLVFPVGVGDEEAIVYLQNATEELILKLEDNFKVGSYLVYINMHEEVAATMSEGSHLSDLDLTKILSPEQLIEFERYTPSDFSGHERCCTTTTAYCYAKICCHGNCKTRYGMCEGVKDK